MQLECKLQSEFVFVPNCRRAEEVHKTRDWFKLEIILEKFTKHWGVIHTLIKPLQPWFIETTSFQSLKQEIQRDYAFVSIADIFV